MSVSSVLALLALAAPRSVAPPSLTPGMAAPKLAVGGWLKSAAPKDVKGRFRVVEFWATWCAPCKASIPHLTELAHRYRGKVDVVGVSVWERPATTVADLKRFVAEFGDRMDYRVAHDRSDKTMATTWLSAAGQRGIPSSFLLDGAGKILWIGHPDLLEPVLKRALAGTLDAANARRTFLEAAAQDERRREAREQAIARVAAVGERYLAGERDAADAAWNVLAAESADVAATVVDARLMVYRYAYGKGEREGAERSWNALAAASPALRERIDESRASAYAERYKAGDREGAEKAWAELGATASPKLAVAIEVERLRAYSADSAERETLLKRMLAGTREEKAAADAFLKTVKKPVGSL